MLRTCHYCGQKKRFDRRCFASYNGRIFNICKKCFRMKDPEASHSLRICRMILEAKQTFYVLRVTEDRKNKGRQGLIKLGITHRLKDRMQQYCSRGLRMQTIGTLEGGHHLEKILLKRFKESLARPNEWFYPTDEMMTWIQLTFADSH